MRTCVVAIALFESVSGNRAPEARTERAFVGAGDRNRTRNLLFTKQLLCQLSYAGVLTEG
jgi:hypothetical protein